MGTTSRSSSAITPRPAKPACSPHGVRGTSTQLAADYAANVPRVERVGARTLRFVAADAPDLIGVITSWYYLAALASQQFSAIAHRR